MSDPRKLTLHVVPLSHPCMAVRAALDLKGLEYEVVTFQSGPHMKQIEEIYGAGKQTVPGLIMGDEPIHGSVTIMERLDQACPEPPLYPEPVAEGVREAELWGDRELQDLGRRLTFGALHFRPEAAGTYGGGGPLDPAGTDFAMKAMHGARKHSEISAVRLAEDLRGLPGKIAIIEGFARDGLIDGAAPTAADLQIGSTIRVLLTVGDLVPLLEGTAGERIARRFFPDYDGMVPAGAFPEGWVPAGIPDETA